MLAMICETIFGRHKRSAFARLCSREIVAACDFVPMTRVATARLAEAGSWLDPATFAVAGYSGFRLIGRGGFAYVFAARRDGTGADVAIKVAARPGDARLGCRAGRLCRIDGANLDQCGTLAEHADA